MPLVYIIFFVKSKDLQNHLKDFVKYMTDIFLSCYFLLVFSPSVCMTSGAT